jgi:hypothetical protein
MRLAAWVGLVAHASCQFPNYDVVRSDDQGDPAGAGGVQAGGVSGAGLAAGTVGTAGTTAGVAGLAGNGGTPGAVEPPMAGAAGEAQAGASGDGGPALSDDFETGSDAWLEVAGSSWSLVKDAESDSTAYQLAPVFSGFYATVAKQSVWRDQVIEARVKVLEFGGTSTGDVVSVMARFDDIGNYYAAVLRPDGRAAIRARVGGGAVASIKTGPERGITTGIWYLLRFELLGTTLRLHLDGEVVAEVEDDRIGEGTVALGGENSSALFDDVRVTVP